MLAPSPSLPRLRDHVDGSLARFEIADPFEQRLQSDRLPDALLAAYPTARQLALFDWRHLR